MSSSRPELTPPYTEDPEGDSLRNVIQFPGRKVATPTRMAPPQPSGPGQSNGGGSRGDGDSFFSAVLAWSGLIVALRSTSSTRSSATRSTRSTRSTRR